MGALALDQSAVAREAERIERDYDLAALADVYRTDWACDTRPQGW